MNTKDRSEHQLKVDEFMKLAGQELPLFPIIPSEAVRQLRANIILEEAAETIEALGGTIVMNDGKLEVILNKPPDLEKIVDGCADVRVVTTGTLSACGVDDLPIQRAVDQANLNKFGPGSYRRGDGKWIKPPDFVPADLGKLLAEQRAREGR